jgi:RNA polymerase sigma-70 factor (ECF subfamily)
VFHSRFMVAGVSVADSPPSGSSSQSDSFPHGAWFDELIRLARGGDRDAVTRIIEGVRDYLLLVANRSVRAELRPKAAPSDLVQETCLDAQRDFGQFAGRTHVELRGWLRQILLSRISHAERHYLRTAKRDPRREIPLDPTRHDESPARDGRPGDAANFDAEDFAELDAVLPSLPQDYRKVIQLRTWERLSFDEVGRRMDRTPDAARKLWGRAVARLSRTLKARRSSGDQS